VGVYGLVAITGWEGIGETAVHPCAIALLQAKANHIKTANGNKQQELILMRHFFELTFSLGLAAMFIFNPFTPSRIWTTRRS
jgi:hypothetical protein